jgi:hypothetical protein
LNDDLENGALKALFGESVKEVDVNKAGLCHLPASSFETTDREAESEGQNEMRLKARLTRSMLAKGMDTFPGKANSHPHTAL